MSKHLNLTLTLLRAIYKSCKPITQGVDLPHTMNFAGLTNRWRIVHNSLSTTSNIDERLLPYELLLTGQDIITFFLFISITSN